MREGRIPSGRLEVTSADDEGPEVMRVRTVDVRETTSLFRLSPVSSNLSRSSRQVAIVAADSEEKARSVAAKHDVFGRDWRDPRFAACESIATTERHVFGDVVFRSEPVVVGNCRRSRSG